MRRGKLQITPYADAHIEAAHINLHLSTGADQALVVGPRAFVTARTVEKITHSSDLCGFMEGRASLAKLGISTEQSSTFVEPGSDNTLTLEIFNASQQPVTLESGQPIAKLILMPVLNNLGT